jgi:uncharacterized protein YgiM (DUF1202 family)
MKKKEEIVPGNYAVKLIVGAGDLAVFNGPGTSHHVVKHLQHGAAVKIWEEKDGWVKVSEKGEEWVLKEHLQVRTR